MLEHYEMAEMEKKWEDYNQNRKKFRINKEALKPSNFRFDVTIVGLIALILVSAAAIIWLLKGSSDANEELMSDAANLPNQMQMPIEPAPVQTQDAPMMPPPAVDKSDYSMATAPQTSSNSSVPSLNMNEIGIDSSVDSAGFTIKNNYQEQPQQQAYYQPQPMPQQYYPQQQGYYQQPQQQASVKSELFGVPQNDIIDFGNAPTPPRNSVTASKPAPAQPSGKFTTSGQPKVVIKKSNKKVNENLEDRFFTNKDVSAAVQLANEKFNKGDYSGARNWALEVNSLDKSNPQGWLIFAKASQKMGKNGDAVTALNAFLKIDPNNAEAKRLLKQLQ